MRELPPGWEWTTLGEIGKYLNGRGFKKSEWSESGRPIIRIQNLTGSGGSFNYYEGDAQERHTVRDGDLLVSWAATLGVYVWRGPEAVLNQHIFKVESQIHPGFHRWLLEHVLAKLQRQTHGSGMVHITKGRFDSTPVPLPPLAEQERIVAAIEEHLSRLDAAEAGVVSARVRLRQMEAKVKNSVLSDAPLVPLGDLALESRYGTSVKCDYESSGPGVVRIPNVVDEAIVVNDLKYATDPGGVPAEVLLRKGDVVFVRTNGSRDLIGRAAVASGSAVGLGFASYLIRYRFRDDVDPYYLCAVMSAPSTRRVLEGLAATTDGQYNLSVSKLDSVRVPLPPLAEQRRLVETRSAALASLARLLHELVGVERRSASLRRSILAAAFSGQLVPQDPDDEPASVLLERIRAERAAAAPTKRTRKAKAS